ncbi:MAG TPA: RNA methyltransferase [Planctomycetota bacterium]|nr:RNA methyltransferase [Planctomycetota bacterium]
MLSSPQNQRVKDYVELRTDGNVRRDKKRFLLEGRKPVHAALTLPHVTVHELIFSDHLLGDDLELVALAQKKHIPLVRVSKDVFKKIADVMTPQGIAAVVKLPEWKPEQVLAQKDALVVVACGLQDPGNVGTIIRSCEASGATGLVTLEHTADPFNAKVVRATAAGLLALPILRMKTADFLRESELRGLRLVATAASNGIEYRKFDWKRRPIALCIGSEGEGLPDAVENACTERVTIPIKGSAESLNAAVAASILLFEAAANG